MNLQMTLIRHKSVWCGKKSGLGTILQIIYSQFLWGCSVCDLTFSFSCLQGVCVEQLTLDFEYLINEVIRRDAAWTAQFCSFSDYDVVILEVRVMHVHTAYY